MEARAHPVGLRSISQRLKSSDSSKKRAQSRGPTFSLFLTEDNLTPLWRAHSSVAAFPVVLHPFGNLRHNVIWIWRHERDNQLNRSSSRLLHDFMQKAGGDPQF
jgi:hypothetical protein